jgi:hypothetical protein
MLPGVRRWLRVRLAAGLILVGSSAWGAVVAALLLLGIIEDDQFSMFIPFTVYGVGIWIVPWTWALWSRPNFTLPARELGDPNE